MVNRNGKIRAAFGHINVYLLNRLEFSRALQALSSYIFNKVGSWERGELEVFQWRIEFIARGVSDSSSNHEWYFRLSSCKD